MLNAFDIFAAACTNQVLGMVKPHRSYLTPSIHPDHTQTHSNTHTHREIVLYTTTHSDTRDDKMIIYMTRKLTTLQHVIQSQSMASIITHRCYMFVVCVSRERVCVCTFCNIHYAVCVCVFRLLLFFSLRVLPASQSIFFIFVFFFGWLSLLCGCNAFVMPHQTK